MKKIKEIVLKIFITLSKPLAKLVNAIAIRVWCKWSNFRFKDSLQGFSVGLAEEDQISGSMAEIRKLIPRLYKRFTYTKDGIDQLGDAITPPPQTYQYFLDGELKDDCDGFHSLMHYVLSSNGIKCYLLTAHAFRLGHCILLFTHKNKWYVNDYNTISGPSNSPAEAVAKYNEIFVNRYNAKSEVFYNGLVNYDYILGKFYVDTSIDIKHIPAKEEEKKEPQKKDDSTVSL